MAFITSKKFTENFRFTRIDESYDSDFTLMCMELGTLPCVYVINDLLISENFWEYMKSLNYKKEDVVVKTFSETLTDNKNIKNYKYYIRTTLNKSSVYFIFNDEYMLLDDDDFVGEADENDKKDKISDLKIFYTSENNEYIETEIVPKIKEFVHYSTFKNKFSVISTSPMGYELRSSYAKEVNIDVEMNYGKSFAKTYNFIMDYISNRKPGLYLFSGKPGTGKCVDGTTMVTLRDKNTGEIIDISIDDFRKNLKFESIIDEKFTEFSKISNHKILTDEGFKDVVALHKTIPYVIYKLVTERKELKCADKHICFLEDGNEIYVKDLKRGDYIKTKDGNEKVIDIEIYDQEKEMWDFELGGDNFKYFTNGILSHNTTFLRHIINTFGEDRTIIYVPSFMMYHLADPEMITFISRFKNAILILEDAENVLTKSVEERGQAVSNLLNFSDGILNDNLNIQIIATFNVEKNIIDDALLRAGRLRVNYKFKKLTAKQATALSAKIGLNQKYNEPKSLAEVYEGLNQLIDTDDLDQKRIGFKFGSEE